MVCSSWGDVLLRFENLLHFPVVSFRPNGVACPRLNHFHVDSQAIAGSTQATSQDMRGTYLLADFGGRCEFVAKSGHCGSGEDLETLDFCQRFILPRPTPCGVSVVGAMFASLHNIAPSFRAIRAVVPGLP